MIYYVFNNNIQIKFVLIVSNRINEYFLDKIFENFPAEIQRIRKDSETVSSPGVTGVLRTRREGDRLRNDTVASDSTSFSAQQRGLTNQPAAREVIKKIYRNLFKLFFKIFSENKNIPSYTNNKSC